MPAPIAARLLHISDCQIGSDDRALAALTDLVDGTERLMPDAVVIVGDLFDHGRVEQADVDEVADALDGIRAPVYILPGNHDHAGPGSIYDRFPSRSCRVIRDPGGELLAEGGSPFAFWGKPCVEHSPEFRPACGAPMATPQRWSVVLAHGLVLADDSPSYQGSPIYPRDLAELDCDYLALGHLGRFQRIGGTAIPGYYCGDMASTAGGAPGGILVDFCPGRAPEVRHIGFRGPEHATDSTVKSRVNRVSKESRP